MYSVQCSNCGTIAGTMELTSNAYLFNKILDLEKKIENIALKLGISKTLLDLE